MTSTIIMYMCCSTYECSKWIHMRHYRWCSLGNRCKVCLTANRSHLHFIRTYESFAPASLRTSDPFASARRLRCRSDFLRRTPFATVFATCLRSCSYSTVVPSTRVTFTSLVFFIVLPTHPDAFFASASNIRCCALATHCLALQRTGGGHPAKTCDTFPCVPVTAKTMVRPLPDRP